MERMKKRFDRAAAKFFWEASDCAFDADQMSELVWRMFNQLDPYQRETFVSQFRHWGDQTSPEAIEAYLGF